MKVHSRKSADAARAAGYNPVFADDAAAAAAPPLEDGDDARVLVPVKNTGEALNSVATGCLDLFNSAGVAPVQTDDSGRLIVRSRGLRLRNVRWADEQTYLAPLPPSTRVGPGTAWRRPGGALGARRRRGKADLASALTAEAIAAPRPTHMLAQQFEPVPAASWQIGALRGAKVKLLVAHDDGWSYVLRCSDARRGMMPSAFLRPLEGHEAASLRPCLRRAAAPPPPLRAPSESVGCCWSHHYDADMAAVAAPARREPEPWGCGSWWTGWFGGGGANEPPVDDACTYDDEMASSAFAFATAYDDEMASMGWEFGDGMEEELDIDTRILVKRCDEDGSGAIDAVELASALEACGTDSSPGFVAGLIERHSSRGKPGSELDFDFEGFGEAAAQATAKTAAKAEANAKAEAEAAAKAKADSARVAAAAKAEREAEARRARATPRSRGRSAEVESVGTSSFKQLLAELDATGGDQLAVAQRILLKLGGGGKGAVSLTTAFCEPDIFFSC